MLGMCRGYGLGTKAKLGARQEAMDRVQLSIWPFIKCSSYTNLRGNATEGLGGLGM